MPFHWKADLPTSEDLPGIDLKDIIMEEIDGGLRVRRIDHYYIDVMFMGFGNRRLCLTPQYDPLTVDRSWCYRGPGALLVTVEEAFRWPQHMPHTHTPDRWYKEVHSGRTQKEFFESALTKTT